MKHVLKFAVLTCALAFNGLTAQAQSLIRDAEIESSLRKIAAPLLSAAGLSQNSVNIYVVNNRSMNAFVAGGRNIFIHHGLVTRLKTVEQLQAVLAHEIAHITGGHLAQRSSDLARARTAAGLGLLLSGAAAAAGAGEAAIGLAAGSQSAATRSFLSHTRAQEASADQAGVRYLSAAGIPPKAALEVLEIFQGQDLLTANRRDPYTLTHPLNSARISGLRGFVAGSTVKAKKSDSAYWYQRMRAKFIGFTGSPRTVLRRVSKSDKSEIATYTRAIAYHQKPDKKRAAQEINRLISQYPNDPYYHELNGQFHLENGNAKSAVTAYRKAVSLSKNQPLIRAGLGRALLAAKSPEALGVLKKAYSADPRDSRMLRDLALAYAQNKQPGLASAITAERYALNGNFKVAATHAKRAQGLLPRGSSGWIKAEDILILSKRTSTKSKR
ncbi:peptidase M48 [Amylibacter marinus]|uniref:Peptidase M48 n=1 Tax=Amylibacter marinus TaxID=1475483 RepID=A0ABQ5VT75_9RHOB|nr:M48 family metalloprotease [Amylibacter marinus]GLQ34354.1 peptidase M48 [Amylibacter marinus]